MSLGVCVVAEDPRGEGNGVADGRRAGMAAAAAAGAGSGRVTRRPFGSGKNSSFCNPSFRMN